MWLPGSYLVVYSDSSTSSLTWLILEYNDIVISKLYPWYNMYTYSLMKYHNIHKMWHLSDFYVWSNARNKDQKLVSHFLKIGYFMGYRLLSHWNVQEIWPTKMDFGQPNAKISQKMANAQQLFLALMVSPEIYTIIYF